MEHVLDNPVYNALLSGDQHLGFGTAEVKFFHEEVSPFIGIQQDFDKGFDLLLELLPANRAILFATPLSITEPKGWQFLRAIKGLQLVFTKNADVTQNFSNLVALEQKHMEQMVALASLTKPGPFGPRTIDFGNYFGIFENNQLVAMAGQRLHVGNYTEISAVCTHPSHIGKGYAAALVQNQINLILKQGQIPFLHVSADNDRAIALYQRLGFEQRSNMNFYFMKRST